MARPWSTQTPCHETWSRWQKGDYDHSERCSRALNATRLNHTFEPNIERPVYRQSNILQADRRGPLHEPATYSLQSYAAADSRAICSGIRVTNEPNLSGHPRGYLGEIGVAVVFFTHPCYLIQLVIAVDLLFVVAAEGERLVVLATYREMKLIVGLLQGRVPLARAANGE